MAFNLKTIFSNKDENDGMDEYVSDDRGQSEVTDKMIILEPENIRHYVNLVYVLELQHKYDEALEYVAKMSKFTEDKEFLKELKKRLRKNKRKFEKENEKSLENKEK